MLTLYLKKDFVDFYVQDWNWLMRQLLMGGYSPTSEFLYFLSVSNRSELEEILTRGRYYVPLSMRLQREFATALKIIPKKMGIDEKRTIIGGLRNRKSGLGESREVTLARLVALLDRQDEAGTLAHTKVGFHEFEWTVPRTKIKILKAKTRPEFRLPEIRFSGGLERHTEVTLRREDGQILTIPVLDWARIVVSAIAHGWLDHGRQLPPQEGVNDKPDTKVGVRLDAYSKFYSYRFGRLNESAVQDLSRRLCDAWVGPQSGDLSAYQSTTWESVSRLYHFLPIGRPIEITYH